MKISSESSTFITYMKSTSIMVIVFGHVGGFWFFKPYSEFLLVFVPVFFFLSGAVSYYSYKKTHSIGEYYSKRYTSLFPPYFLMCIIALAVAIINHGIPKFNLNKILLWVQMIPTEEMMPFPIGHIWFLHTLFFLILASPWYILLLEKNRTLFSLLLLVMVIISIGQFSAPTLYQFFILKHHNLFKPLIHSIFFGFGILCFSDKVNTQTVLIIMITSLSVSLFLASLPANNIDIDLSYHAYAPDIYYVSVSMCFISFAYLVKRYINQIANSLSVIRISMKYLGKYTYSIFLLHPFAIYLVEIIYYSTYNGPKDIRFGVIKLIIVLLLTIIVSLPFTYISNFLIGGMRKSFKALKLL